MEVEKRMLHINSIIGEFSDPDSSHIMGLNTKMSCDEGIVVKVLNGRSSLNDNQIIFVESADGRIYKAIIDDNVRKYLIDNAYINRKYNRCCEVDLSISKIGDLKYSIAEFYGVDPDDIGPLLPHYYYK